MCAEEHMVKQKIKKDFYLHLNLKKYEKKTRFSKNILCKIKYVRKDVEWMELIVQAHVNQ